MILEWSFGGLVKKLERAARNVSKDLVKDAGQEIERLIDEQLSPLADQLDYMAKKRINQVFNGSSELKDAFKADIGSLLTNADDKARQALEALNQVREEGIRDLRKTTGQTNIYLENRIDQFSLVVISALKSAQEIGNEFTPEAFNQKLVEPNLTKINFLEEKLLQDSIYILEQIDETIKGIIEQIRNELRKHITHALPNPLDRCRWRLKIALKPGGLLSDIELYQLSQCYELSKLDENTPIDEVLKTYGQLELNAMRMTALVKDIPELKIRALQDRLKYGVLCEFWREVMKSYDSRSFRLLMNASKIWRLLPKKQPRKLTPQPKLLRTRLTQLILKSSLLKLGLKRVKLLLRRH